jgi:uncharacterized membrane-anchored protein
MKVRLALAVAALQVLVLAFMAGQREWIARTGTPVTLRTAPIDPGDPMRGAYVRFDYEIGVVPAALCRGAPAQWFADAQKDYRTQYGVRDRVVYAALKVNEHGLAELVSLSDAPPASGLCLRGRVQNLEGRHLRVRYGIEAMFMSQAAATKIEEAAISTKSGAPMNTTVAVGSSGVSVLRGFRWEPLGLTFAFDRPPTQRQPRDPTLPWRPQPLTGMTVTLHNYGDKDLAIVNLPGAQAFRLVTNTRAPASHYRPAREGQAAPAPKPEDILVLRPGATHSVHLDLTQPDWWIIDTAKAGSGPFPMQQLQDGWSASFRIEYAPPTAEAVRVTRRSAPGRSTPIRAWIDVNPVAWTAVVGADYFARRLTCEIVKDATAYWHMRCSPKIP